MPETLLEAEVTVPEVRDCTRCAGMQHLTAYGRGMGSYRCDDCAMAVGFDLEAHPAEFLLFRGIPGRYTQSRFGERILPSERRLPAKA
jgi:hypothetical protein